MKSFKQLLRESAAVHGHICPGQVIGIRMALLGCRLIGVDVPTTPRQVKKIIVYVEMDRCTADAIALATGVKLGRRSLKFKDYGIMAATFFNLDTQQAFRVISTESSRALAHKYASEIIEKRCQQITAYERMPDSILFRVQRVHVKLTDFELPGPTRRKITCSRCGQLVRDGKEAIISNRVFCRPCTDESYFSNPEEISWEKADLAQAV